MNCEDFNKIIHELADYKPMQVTVRDDGVSHVALCADCATKLAGARILSTSLVTAAGAESEEAPARIKQNLLAAFTAIQSGTTKPRAIEETDEAVELPPLEASFVAISTARRYRWWTAATVAVAAVILLAVVLPIWRKASQSPSQPPVGDLKAGLIDDSRTARVVDDKAKTSSPIDNPLDRPIVRVKSASSKRRLFTPRRSEAGGTVDTNQTVAQNTGEYLPLTYLAKSTAIDSGTIVRVELSRSALASLGIRTNFEGTGKSVKADVVVGDDGVAQAIRLVQ
jgi:hypothetical protein